MIEPESEHRVMLYAEDIRPLKAFFEAFIKFDLMIGDDGLAHFVAHSGRNTFVICPEHRKAFRPDSNVAQGLWRYKIDKPPA